MESSWYENFTPVVSSTALYTRCIKVFTLLEALDCLDRVDDDYGVCVDDPMPPIEAESVIVPKTQFTLNPTEMMHTLQNKEQGNKARQDK